MMEFLQYLISQKELLIQYTFQHLRIGMLAVLAAIVVGVPLGILIGRIQKFSKPVIGFANVMQAIPSLALMGFFIPFIGIGDKTAIVIIALYALLPILKNTFTGLTNIDKTMIEAARGIDHPDWLAFVQGVVPRLAAARNGDGEYPFTLSEQTGAGLEYDSLGSAWCLAAEAALMQLTGDTADLPAMERSEVHYYDAFIRRAECYGGPPDTSKAVDSEGVLAYIRVARLLHELTGKAVYLDHLRDALCYEYSFKFCYNVPVQVPPLSRLGWSSCGGSITSVANPHIHPMSCTVADEMFYYLRRRPDAYIESRLKDTVGWSLQTFNTFDREYDYGRAGWMSERFCHCEGLLVQTYPDGSLASTWFAPMPWACGSVLEGVCGTWWDYKEKEENLV